MLLHEVAQWAYAHIPSQSPFVKGDQKPPDGTLVVPHMAPGPYRLCATRTGQAEQCRAGILAPGGDLELLVE